VKNESLRCGCGGVRGQRPETNRAPLTARAQIR
jgi:hypothetical protein